jgi:3'(2'), 5'-bisphosphate nucleotidase
MLDLTHAETHFTLQAVRQATLLVRQVQAEMVSAALTKEDRSPVTVADFACQALVSALLQREFPGELLAAEESANALRQPQGQPTLERVTRFVGSFLPGASPSQVCEWIDRGQADPGKRYWTLDPVDGTKGFLRNEQYAVALARVVAGQVQVGALGCPQLRYAHIPATGGPGSIVIAQAGQGAWFTALEGEVKLERLHVSDCQQASTARLLRSVEAGHTDVSKIDLFAQAMGIAAPLLPMDSQAKYAVLASGNGELVMRLLTPAKPDYREKIWDQAAGALIVAEAGGRISDLDGKALDFTRGRTLADNRGILATNGKLHAAALEALRRVGA